ncbi:MBL fold metallo-hydrolase [Paenibacillus hodogayensis]|uniref:beta-lactamase n=1 Tax=Paenibacillus hodogayensis TaxID=279208 RepID=A0ABV5VTS9_9BACL
MRLTDRVSVIGGGGLGYRLSSFYDCNVYALETGAETIVIDAGSGIEPELLFGRLAERGVRPERIGKLLLTHGHADHAGGAAEWKARYGVQVIAAASTSVMVESGDEIRTSLAQARAAGTYPEWYRLAPCPIDRIVRVGEDIRSGDLTLRIVSAAGHSFDMIAAYCPELKALFAGDAVFAEGRLAVIDTPDFSMDRYRETIAGLALLDVEQLYPGHGEALTRDGREAIRLANDRFVRGLEPLSIV